MRDCYVGDIGDFAKYGLLRAIGKGKRLGVAWYLCGDPEVNNTGDGRHTAYLQRPDEWRHLDPDLFDSLKNVIDEKRRSVAEIEKSGILGNADFADEPVDVTDYYGLKGKSIYVPKSVAQKPDAAALIWHNDKLFLGMICRGLDSVWQLPAIMRWLMPVCWLMELKAAFAASTPSCDLEPLISCDLWTAC